MNKIYKLIWSKVRNDWVVASEIAKGHGKSSSPEGNGKRLKSLVLMALLGCFMTGLGQGVQADGTNSYSWGSGSVTIIMLFFCWQMALSNTNPK